MYSIISRLAAPALGAILLTTLSLAPASAQSGYGGYGGSYGGGYSSRGSSMYGSGQSSYGSNYGSQRGYGSSQYNNQSKGQYGYGSSYGSNSYSRYLVRRGDTLNKLAARFGVSVGALLRANPGIKDPDRIFAGQTLRIPNGYGSSSYDYDDNTYGKGYGGSGYGSNNYGNKSYGNNAYGSNAYGNNASASNAYGNNASASQAYGSQAAPMAPMAPMQPAPVPAPAPMPAPAPQQQTVDINLTAQNIAFSMSSITVPAGARVVVHFTNLDATQHNFAVYTDSSAQQAIFRGQLVNGPNASMAYQFDAPSQPGTYFFRCDIHPGQMNGSFIVQ